MQSDAMRLSAEHCMLRPVKRGGPCNSATAEIKRDTSSRGLCLDGQTLDPLRSSVHSLLIIAPMSLVWRLVEALRPLIFLTLFGSSVSMLSGTKSGEAGMANDARIAPTAARCPSPPPPRPRRRRTARHQTRTCLGQSYPPSCPQRAERPWPSPMPPPRQPSSPLGSSSTRRRTRS